MKKAIRLRVIFWIEGEAEPAHDFSESTIKAIGDLVAAGQSSHPELKFSIQSITESPDEDDEPPVDDRAKMA